MLVVVGDLVGWLFEPQTVDREFWIEPADVGFRVEEVKFYNPIELIQEQKCRRRKVHLKYSWNVRNQLQREVAIPQQVWEGAKIGQDRDSEDDAGVYNASQPDCVGFESL